MERSARRLATLVPALLCAIWSLVLAPAATADPAPAPATHAPRTSPARAALKSAEGWLERSRAGDSDPTWLGFYS
ncbi:hypothetical protein ADL08_04945, partial [Streptomyces sp. NRRL F-6492]